VTPRFVLDHTIDERERMGNHPIVPAPMPDQGMSFMPSKGHDQFLIVNEFTIGIHLSLLFVGTM
jgi:hypothetical protein